MMVGPIFTILVSAFIVVAFVHLAGLTPQQSAGPLAARKATDESAVRMLRERFAKGEIDATEYEHRKASLVG